jgi:transposase
MKESVLGIDISKSTFDVALIFDDKVKTKKFNNNAKGFDELKEWLDCKSITNCRICMEATGIYGLKIAEYLYINNFKVSVVNPARIKGFAMSKLSRVKTDKKDSELIADFCKVMKPDLWQPTPKHIEELQQWVKRLDSLIGNKNIESNRLESADKNVSLNIKAHIDFLNKQIEEVERSIINHIKNHKDLNDKSQLLNTIPGVGEKTISVILAFLNTGNFNSVKQAVAFLGLNPKPRQSGTSISGRSRISKTGDASQRKAFYMPALVCIRFNPIIKDFAERLSSTGKSKMIVVVASMRKLIHIIYGVLKNKTPFNPELI